jgi:hypothetical protein
MLRSPVRMILAALAAAALFLSGTANAQNSPAAQHVLDRARAASGGKAWNGLRGFHETGDDGGVRYERWLDPLRYGDRTETQTPAGKHVQGYNGWGEWRVLADGVVTGSTDRAVLARVRSEAFFGAYAYLYPSRFDVRCVLVGVRQHQGRPFDVVRVDPNGGRARELWFDRRSGLLTLMIDAGGPKPVTIEVSDYRRVGPVLIPFRTVTSGGDLARPRQRQIESIDFRPADRALFSLPAKTTQSR